MKLTCLVLLTVGLVPPRVPEARAQLAFDRYRPFEELASTLESLVRGRENLARLETIGTSREGRALYAVELAGTESGDPSSRPALLLVAGVSGEHLVGTEACLAVIEHVLGRYWEDETIRALLERTTLYVIPRANPDAAERCFAAPLAELRGNARPVDDDRDGTADEDGPQDLNGDGFITWMRVKDPEGDRAPDPEEPRLLKKAERAKGERGVYKVLTEGIDDDGDGEINEDGPGGVVLDRNFPHRYEMHSAGAGPHQVSEPESRALADFLLAHRQIAAVLVYGPHDNLIEAPRGGDRGGAARSQGEDEQGEAPRFRRRRSALESIDPQDLPYFEHVSARYREITGTKGKAVPAEPGSFLEWVYFHQGVPAFGSRIWHGPEEAGDEGKEREAAEGAEEGPPVAPEERRGGPARRGEARAGAGGRAGAGSPGDEEIEADRRWLRWIDREFEGAWFVDWTPIDHPTLGAVEVGGFVPYLKINPPPAELASLLPGQVEFAVELLAMMPRVEIRESEVEAKGGDVYEVRVEVANGGYLPTALRHGQTTRRAGPVLVRVDLHGQRLLTGEPLHRIDSLEGSYGSRELVWLVQGAPGTVVTVVVDAQRGGADSVDLRL